MKYLDLTHTFTQDMPVYPGDPKPRLEQTAFLEKDGYNEFHIAAGMHVGTHIDAPLHMLENGKKLSEYPPERFFGTGHLLDAREKPIDAALLEGRDIGKGDIVLVMAGWSRRFGQPDYYEGFPEVTEEFARKAVELGIGMVGMDTPSPDGPPFTVHKLLLGGDIFILENLTNLEALVGCDAFEVIALPPKMDADGALLRVVARVL